MNREQTQTQKNCYLGFEQGPIRPPSEAYSLLIRATRNCPWNRCTFCPVYKGQKFSLRTPDQVKRDVDAVGKHLERLRSLADSEGVLTRSAVVEASGGLGPEDMDAFSAAVQWAAAGMQSIFIQDANSLIMKPAGLAEVLRHIKSRFPWVERITSYARSHTLSRISDQDMKMLRQAGLTRIHLGMESGSDRLLTLVKKGVTKQRQIEGGLRVKRAGIELSEYVMPGLGGVALSREHALETADALNQIDPEFIRLRTLRIFPGLELYDQWQAGLFQKCSEAQVVEELVLFIESLSGITSVIKSDHMNNLLEEVEGRLPEDREAMLHELRGFLALPAERQSRYFLGRGLGLFRGVADLEDPQKAGAVERAYRQLNATPDTVEDIILQLRAGRM